MEGEDETGGGEGRQLDSSSDGIPSARDKTEGEREQIKLQAAYLNGVAIGLFLIGGLSIPATILLSSGSGLLAIGVAVLCHPASFVLHKVAKRSLRELDR